MANPYTLDFNPLMNALESNQQADFQRNRLAMEQRRLGMAEESHDWERKLQPIKFESATLGLERDKKMLPLDLRARTAEATRSELGVDRERAMMPLDVAARRAEISGFGYSNEAKRRELEKDLYGRAAAVGQLVENEPDLEKQKALLQRWYTTDPTIRQHLGTTLPKELLDDPVAVTRYLRAVAAGYQAPQMHNLAPGHSLVATARNPADPMAPAKPTLLFKADEKGEQFKDEHQLRQELAALPTIKTFSEVKAGYTRMLEGDKLKTGAGDLAIVYGYMKMLDPTSVVREGEFATAEKTAGVPEQIRTIYNKVVNGERISDVVRTNFVSAANQIYQRNLGDVAKLNEQYRAIALRNKLNPANVLLDHSIASPPGGPVRDDGPAPPRFGGPPALREGAAPAPVAPRAEAPAPTAPRLPPGTTPDMAIQQAREAIAAGKDRNAVIQRLRELGISPSGL